MSLFIFIFVVIKDESVKMKLIKYFNMSKRQSAADINVGDIYGCIEVLEKLSPEKFKVRCNRCGLERIHHFQWLRELKELQPKKCRHCDDYKPNQILGKIRLIKKISPEK